MYRYYITELIKLFFFVCGTSAYKSSCLCQTDLAWFCFSFSSLGPIIQLCYKASYSTHVHVLTLLILETEYFSWIPCLLMPWLLKLPEHQQAWYWLCGTVNMYCCSRHNYTLHTTKLLGGILVSLRPSVHPSVRPASRVRSVVSTVQDGFFPYLVQMINSMRGCIAFDDPWPWPISSRSFSLDLENRVRSVASTVLDGFFLYLAQMITIIRGRVACNVFSESGNLNFWQIFKNFRPWPWKKPYSSRWILSLFSTNDH